MSTSRSTHSDVEIDRLGHRVLMGTIVMATGAAAVLGFQFDSAGLSLLLALPLCTVALAAWTLAPHARGTRYVLAVVLMALTAVQIQVTHGLTEMHFGVFVTLALLLVYRDWTVILAAAAFIAVHHLLFDRLQAAGWGVYCVSTPDLLLVLMHAAYVLTQSAVEVFIAIGLRRIAAEGDELRAIIARVDSAEGLALDAAGSGAGTGGGQALQHALGRMAAVVRAVHDSAQSVQVASAEIAAGNNDLSRRTEQQASALEETSASVAELTTTVADAAQAARAADGLAREASQVAERGGVTMADVVRQMGGISESSRRIGEITAVIDGIAFQTNILALNASVEAARAGEQGRGFAVVASEVRSLAQRSADAAKEIKDLLSRSASQVEAGQQLVDQAGRTMQDIVDATRRVGEMIAGISSAGEQQRSGFAQVDSAVRQIDQATQQNAALVEQSAAAAASLQTQAQQLVAAVSAFRLEPAA